MSTAVDLNAIRAARREANGEAPTVIFGDPPQTFALPVELPAEAIDKIDALGGEEGGPGVASAILELLRSLLGESYDEFMKLRPSLDDLQALFEGIMPLYGTDMGESPASES